MRIWVGVIVVLLVVIPGTEGKSQLPFLDWDGSLTIEWGKEVSDNNPNCEEEWDEDSTVYMDYGTLVETKATSENAWLSFTSFQQSLKAQWDKVLPALLKRLIKIVIMTFYIEELEIKPIIMSF